MTAPVLVTVGFLILTGQWQLTLHALLATLGALMVSAAVGTVTGALWQTPQPPPGQNAFARSSGGGLAAMLS